MTTNTTPVPTVSPNLVFLAVAFISIVGFIAITLGTVELSKPGFNTGPLPPIFALSGFTALVLICRYLLKLIAPPFRAEVKPAIAPASYAPPALPRGTTNRSLNEAPASYQSVIEESTRQFEQERRSNS